MEDQIKVIIKGIWEDLYRFDESWSHIFNNMQIAKLFYEALYKTYKYCINNGLKIQDICPYIHFVLKPFILCRKDRLKAVIIGQDPYTTQSSARGCCFSTGNPSIDPIEIPLSLKNIYSSLKKFNHINTLPDHGCLYNWCVNGVLMINVTLMYINKEAQNDFKKYWQPFTDRLLKVICEEHPNIIWILWGGDAKAKEKILITNTKNVYRFSHPSPLSENRITDEANKFVNNDHFGIINSMLKENKLETIDWNVEETTTIYCDGSCYGNNSTEKDDRSAGYAILFANGPMKGDLFYQSLTKLDNNVLTNNRAELIAVIQAFDMVLCYETIGQLEIITDSEYTYNMVTSYINLWSENEINERKNPDLIKIIKQYAIEINKKYMKYGGLQMFHIARNSNKYASKVDEYAKIAALNNCKDKQYLKLNINELA